MEFNKGAKFQFGYSLREYLTRQINSAYHTCIPLMMLSQSVMTQISLS